MNDRLLVLTFLLLVWAAPNACGQTSPKESLTSIFQTLQRRYEVHFNYASELTDEIELAPPAEGLSLTESLQYLQQRLNFVFEPLSETTFSVTKKESVICGYVLDKDSGEPLPYVTVQLGSSGTITNEKGYFEVERGALNESLQLRHIGHKELTRAFQYLSDTNCNTLYLTPYHEQLDEIVLYDYIIRGISKLSDGSYEIDFNKYSLLPGLLDEDVLQTIQALPGILSIDETVSNINIRGGSHDQNLILWDGIKMYQSGHFFGLISMYNPFITDKVSLQKNGSSPSLTDGVSGTISMQTDDYLNPNTKGGLAVNLIDASGFADVPIGKNMSVKVAARKSLSDFVDTPTYTSYLDRVSQNTELSRDGNFIPSTDIAFDFYDVALRALYHPTDKDRIQLNFINVDNSLSLLERGTVNGTEETRQSTVNQNSIAGGLAYERIWSKSVSSKVSVYNTDYMLNASNANIEQDQRFDQENSVSETGIALGVQKTISGTAQLSGGYQFMETKVTNIDDVDDPRFLELIGEVLRTHAAWSAFELDFPNGQTKLNAGLRYNYLPKFEKHILEPRLALNHKFSEILDLEILGEFKHQGTSQIINFQNDFLGLEKRRWQLANDDDIPVITSRQVSIGLGYNNSGWLANGVVFYKLVNGITTQSQGFLDSYEFVGAQGDYAAYGFEFLLRKQLNKSSFWAGYSFLKSDYLFEELPETEFPTNFDSTHALSLGANYVYKQFQIAGGFNYRTGRPFTAIVGEDPVVDGEINYADANAERQTPFFRIDASATYHVDLSKKSRLRLGASVWNLLNRRNVLSSFYRMDENDEINKIEQFSLGITPNFSARLMFD